MSDTLLRRIKSVEARPGYRLALVWDRGQSATVDLSDMISKGGVFAELSDQHKFGLVRIGEHDRNVEWPGATDDFGHPVLSIDADALIAKAFEQDSNNLAATMRGYVSGSQAAGKKGTARSAKG